MIIVNIIWYEDEIIENNSGCSSQCVKNDMLMREP